MTNQTLGYVSVSRTLTIVSQQRVSGELTFSNGRQQWYLYFFHGRLVYGTGSLHRVRRWYRALKRHCPGVYIRPDGGSDVWEYELLCKAIADGKLTVVQAKAVIQSSLLEVLFALVSNPTLTPQWSTERKVSPTTNSALGLLLSPPQLEWSLQAAGQLWRKWQTLGLGSLTPYVIPVLSQQLGSELGALPPNLASMLQGNHTLWDIAAEVNRPITGVMQFLLPWAQQGVLIFEESEGASITAPLASVTPVVQREVLPPLIACIDDSPMVGEVLAKILRPAGYRLMAIQEPMAGLGKLVQQRPDFIFIDLIMPETDGYNLCNFLRKSQLFAKTPIFILTGQDGLLDRTCAKFAGASGFLSKPPDPQLVLNTVRKHLQTQPQGQPSLIPADQKVQPVGVRSQPTMTLEMAI